MKAHPKPISISSHAGFGANTPSPHPVLALTAQWIAELPEPMVLRLRVPGAPVPVCIWTGSRRQTPSATSAAAAPAAGPALADQIIFDRGELAALVCATQADRLWHADFLGLCFEKWRKPEVDISSDQLLAGANPDPSQVWTLERVLRRLGLELEAVEFDTTPVARPLHAAA